MIPFLGEETDPDHSKDPVTYICEAFFEREHLWPGNAFQYLPAPFPIKCLVNQLWEKEPIFDPLLHLEMARPNSHSYSFPEEHVSPNETSFKFTDPFQVLSSEGLRVVLDIVERNMSYVRPGRQHSNIRGLGYRSRFIKDLNQSTLLTEYFGDLMGGLRL